mmetsp:Transcript_4190/g.8407  ORF Transcript_4190/g.8407 Transcript_4190/m.8407 type:complete len:242 (+) Transcript_4190:597-1322(+)
MWNKQHYISRQIKQVKGLDKSSHAHEMRRHYESTDKTAYRLFEYLREPDDEFTPLFKTKIKRFKQGPPVKGFKSAEDKKYLVKHEHGVIVIPSNAIERVLNDPDRSDSIIQQLQLKETTQMMKNLEKLTENIVSDPKRRIRKRKLLDSSIHKIAKSNRVTPDCCALIKNSVVETDSPLSRSISKRYSSLFDDTSTSNARSVSPYREKSEERVREMLDYYKSYDYSPRPLIHLPLLKRPIAL